MSEKEDFLKALNGVNYKERILSGDIRAKLELKILQLEEEKNYWMKRALAHEKTKTREEEK